MTLATHVLGAIWRDAGLPEASLHHVALTGTDPVLPSAHRVGTAAQASLAAAALAAAELGALRNGVRQQIRADMHRCALESCGHFRIDARAPSLWDPLAGLYRCGPHASGWVRLHTNFAHHRDGVLTLLGLPTGTGTTRAQVAQALTQWQPLAFEQAATEAGLVVAALRSPAQWAAHPQSSAVATQPLVAIERIGEAAPLPWTALASSQRPLHGVRVLELTRILAGPVAGRTLAAYGADVLLVNAAHLPNIEALIDTSRGKLSAWADLRDQAGREKLREAVRGAHVFLQSYRPGALESRGFGPRELARIRPGVVYASLSAYGPSGPWARRRGFDSLVQATTGLNVAEGQACGSSEPRALPMQILDMASGFLLAFGMQVALWRQQREGGSWHVQISLARTAQWLRALGTVEHGFDAPPPDFSGWLESSASGYGELQAMAHSAEFSHTPAGWTRPSMPPGTHPLAWPIH